MSKLYGNRTVTAVGSLVLAGLVVACGGERAAQASSDPGGVPIAQAPPTEAVAGPVTFASNVTPPSPAPAPVLTSTTYADAEAVFRKGRYKDAADLFAGYVEAHPRSASGQYMLGLSAWKSGDRGRAEQALLSAVALDGGNVKARTNLGRVLLEQGRAVEALPHLEKAVELSQESHEVWRVLGNVYAEMGRHEEALDAYHEALVRNDKDAWSMNNYGLVLIQMGLYEEALRPLARAVELTPRSPVFQNNLGVALERSGFLADARNAFAAAVDADSTYTKAKVSLERVTSRLADSESEPVDLEGFARCFVEEMGRWRAGDHEGC